MRKYRFFVRLIYAIMFAISANSFNFVKDHIYLWWMPTFCFIASNLLIGIFDLKVWNVRLAICNHGWLTLSAFSVSVMISGVYHAYLIIAHLQWGWSMLISIICHAVFFWNGIISVYCTSIQLGIKQRVIGAICGPIPVFHLFALADIIKITRKEVLFEAEKLIINENRSKQELCKTKYPILLVHGVFFRDNKYLDYWGRIPGELIKNGATVYYGNHQSASSVKNSAEELARRITKIINESGCGKVNIIAHSKGGLDCREAIANFGVGKYVASLTTINTPHRGCVFAEHLLEIFPAVAKKGIAKVYNKAARVLGDFSPDFMAAVTDLCQTACMERDNQLGVPEDIFCQSVGSIQKNAKSGKFPVNVSYDYVKKFDGENDGLVSESSFSFGEKYTLVRPKGDRGISHADMIDLNRENIEGFDVREFYVMLVSDLKERGF